MKLHHIESDSMRIRVEQGKRKKDRYTFLSSVVLAVLWDVTPLQQAGIAVS